MVLDSSFDFQHLIYARCGCFGLPPMTKGAAAGTAPRCGDRVSRIQVNQYACSRRIVLKKSFFADD